MVFVYKMLISTQTSTTTHFRPLPPDANVTITVSRIVYDSKLTLLSLGVFLFVVLVLFLTWVRNVRRESTKRQTGVRFWVLTMSLLYKLKLNEKVEELLIYYTKDINIDIPKSWVIPIIYGLFLICIAIQILYTKLRSLRCRKVKEE